MPITDLAAGQDAPGAACAPLSALIERGELSAEDSLPLLRQLAAALDELHAQKRVHGRLRPSLIAVDESNGVRIALDSRDDSPAGKTEALLHLAPEQLRGEAPSAASDQFALGLIAHLLVLGRPAFAAEGPAESTFLACYGLLDQSADGFFDCATQAVFDRVLSVNSAHRFPSCLEFIEALEKIPRRSFSETRIFESAESSPISLDESETSVSGPRRRSLRAWWAAAAITSLLAFLLGAANWRAQNELDSTLARARDFAPGAVAPSLQNGRLEVCNVSAEPLHVRELAAAYIDASNRLRVFNSTEHTPDGWLVAPGQSSVLSWRVGSDSDWDGAVLFYFLHVEGSGKESVLAGRWNSASTGCLHLN